MGGSQWILGRLGVGCIYFVQDMDWWQALVNMVMTFVCWYHGVIYEFVSKQFHDIFPHFPLQ
jgi:hypothetical protein